MPLILVIDDQPQIRKMARHILSMAGHAVVEAEDGAVGLKQLAVHRPAIVLTDILMPGTEGLETIFAIRRAAPDVKSIALSGAAAIAASIISKWRSGPRRMPHSPNRSAPPS